MDRKEYYNDYIKSLAWTVKRRSFIAQHPAKACFCGSVDNLHVHHATYDRLGREDFGDLRLVCSSCHEMIHYYHRNSGIPHTLEQATNEYIRLWLEGNEPKVQITKRTQIPERVYRKVRSSKPRKNIPKHQNHADVNIRRKANRDKREAEKRDLSDIPWEQLTSKQKKKVDFNRFDLERQEKNRQSAQGKRWDQMNPGERKVIDPERHKREHLQRREELRQRKERVRQRKAETDRVKSLVDEEKRRRANGL